MTRVGLYAQDPRNVFSVPARAVTRDKIDLVANETVCRVDQTFAKERSRNGRVTLLQKKALADPMQLIKRAKGDIEDHVDRRVAFFFQQLVCCYDTPFHFEIGDTDAQGPSAPGIKVAQGKSISFNSAHSATIPMLYAYPRGAYVKAQAENTPKPEGFCYLKGSDYYHNANSTIEMPKLVNSADIALDGTRNDDNRLRNQAIRLLNRVALGEITPEEGLALFLGTFSMTLREVIAKTGNEPTKRILELYLDQVNAIQRSDDLAERLLLVKLAGETAGLRQDLLQKRYKMILRAQEVQSLARKKIAMVKADMLGINRKPAHFDKVLKATLLKEASALDRRVLTKLFHSSLPELESQIASAKRTKTAETKIALHHRETELLLRDLRVAFRGLDSEEYGYRSVVMATLRRHRGLTQRAMAVEYARLFPISATSQPTICRLERTYKPISYPIGQELAQVFNVDEGLFFLSQFNSRDTPHF